MVDLTRDEWDDDDKVVPLRTPLPKVGEYVRLAITEPKWHAGPRLHRFAGKVISMPTHAKEPDTFAVFVHDSPVRTRIVAMWLVHSINGERVRGHAQREPVVQRDREWKVTGSKGDTYIVTCKVNGQWSCTCKGYGYRHACSHIDSRKKENA